MTAPGTHRWLHDDEAMAIPLVLGVLALLTVVAFGSFVLAQQALTQSEYVQGESDAFQIANAGIDAALEDMYRNGFNEDHYPMSGTVGGGQYSLEMTQQPNSEYVVTSTGTDATGHGERIVVKFFYINLWEMVFAAGNKESLTAGGGGFNGNSNVTGPFFVRGNVELGGTSYVHKGPFFVDGAIVRSGSAEIGTAAEPIQVYVAGQYPPAGPSVYYSNVSQSVPRIELPRLPADDLLGMAQKAKAESIDNLMGAPAKSLGANQETDPGNPQPTDYRTVDPPNTGPFVRSYASTMMPAGQYYKYVDDNGTPAAPGEGSFGLTIGSRTFGAFPGNGYVDAAMWDDFGFDAATNTLYIGGTVFVDGPVLIDASIDGPILYVGNGAIVANGDIVVNGNLYPATLDRSMDAGHTLGLVSPADLTVTAIPPSNKTAGDPPDHACALYGQGTIQYTCNELFVGSLVAGKIDMGNNNAHLVTDPDLPKYLPESMPGRDQPILTKGAWARQ